MGITALTETNSQNSDTQRLISAIDGIKYTDDTDKKAITRLRHALYTDITDSERLIKMINLMNDTNCSLRVIDASGEDTDIPKRGGAFIDPLSSRTKEKPEVTIYYDNNMASAEITMVHEIMGHLKSYQGKCQSQQSHIKSSNFYDFIMENAMEEANAVAIEAEEAHKSEKTWNEFKTMHHNIACRFEKMSEAGKDGEQIYREIFKAWFDETEYQKTADIQGGKGYSKRFAREYLYYRYADDDKVRASHLSSVKTEYPYLKEKDLNGILRSLSNGRLDDKIVNIPELAGKFKIRHKDWLRLNDMAAKNPDMMHRDMSYSQFSTYDYDQAADMKYIRDKFEFITEQFSDKTNPELRQARASARTFINGYMRNDIIPTENGELMKSLKTWILAEKKSRHLRQQTQVAVTAMENLIISTPDRYPDAIKAMMPMIKNKETNVTRNMTALALRPKKQLMTI